MPREAAWKTLLEEYPDFKRWYNNLARGSINTANENARVLFRFMKNQEITLEDILTQSEQNRREFENLLFDFVTMQEQQGKAPTYLANYIKVVNSWLTFNNQPPIKKIKIGNRNRRPTIEDERISTKEELKQILNYADERERTSISLVAFSGLRPESLGLGNGTDGLKIKDLPELEIKESETSFTSIPTQVIIRHELSKSKQRYMTFLGPEGCEYLKSYLDKRIVSDEQLDLDSPVIAYKSGYGETGYRDSDTRRYAHLTTKTVTKEIRDAMRPRYDWRPYVLRSYFDTQLLVADNNGKMTHAYRQFFMAFSISSMSLYQLRQCTPFKSIPSISALRGVLPVAITRMSYGTRFSPTLTLWSSMFILVTSVFRWRETFDLS